MMSDLVLVGRVARAHGNKGQVIVNLDTDFADERFRPGAVVLVGEQAVPTVIESVRFQQGRPILGFQGIHTMDAAEALAGAELKVPMSTLGPLPEGTFYHFELVGCDVQDVEGHRVGRVAGVEGTLERSRLVVEGDYGEVLIPLAADICVGIDVAQRRIVVSPPDGLLELNARRTGRPAC
jgi:16S rRNA processing protein RimM